MRRSRMRATKQFSEDHRSSRSGRPERARNGRNLEAVGHYNPLTSPPLVMLKHGRVEHWTKNGAQLSDTVKRLVEKNPPMPVQPVA